MQRNKTTYSTILAFLITIGCVILVLFFTRLYFKSRLESQIINSSKDQFNHEVNALLEMNYSIMAQAVYDYSYWDEFVKAIENQDTIWCKANVSLINTFKCDYVCIYNKNYEVVCEFDNVEGQFRHLISKSILNTFSDTHKPQFFLSTHLGLIEMFYTSVHPSLDTKHTQTQPSGYLYVGRRWDNDFLSRLTKIVGAPPQLLPTTESIRNGGSKFVTAKVNLPGWDGKAISTIVFTRVLNHSFNATQNMMYVTILFALTVLLIVNAFARKYINRPLKLITKILVSENKESILILKSYPAEFGRIGDLFERFVSQKTELENARIKAEESEAKYRNLYVLIRLMSDTMPDMIWAKDLNNKYIFANRAISENLLSAKDTAEPIGKADSYFAQRQRELHPEDSNWHTFDTICAETDAITLQQMKPMQFDEFGHVKGKFLFLDVHKTPLVNSEGKLMGVVGTGRDITAQKKVEEELIKAKEKAEESDRLKTAFLQNMSHEIRTPMNAIMGFSEILAKNYNNKPKLEKYSEIINRRCNDLLVIIDDILDIARIESGQLLVNNEECDLNALFVELTHFYNEHQKRVGKEQIQFCLQALCEPLDCIIVIDMVKLKQIFINLISNAFKFTEVGTIEGGCKYDENRNLIFYVSDTGIGVPPDKQKVIFERFAQIEHLNKRLYGGTGLGLSIVKGLLGLLGGEIFLHSELGKGSTFTFIIPFRKV